MEQYTDEEIRIMYRDARNKTYMISILQDLTLKTKEQVLEILGLNTPVRRNTANYKGRRRTWDCDLALELYRQGKTDVEIAKRVRVTPGTIGYWRSTKGLETLRKSAR